MNHIGTQTMDTPRLILRRFTLVGARHDTSNPASGAVMRKCGMKYEGTLRMADRNNQGICDAVWYGLLAAERNPG